MWLKSPLALGTVIAMERSSPNTQCHFPIPIHFWIRGIPARISLKRFYLGGRKYIVMLTVSITNPRRTWQVNHIHYPAIIFFNDNTFLRLAKLPESQGQNT